MRAIGIILTYLSWMILLFGLFVLFGGHWGLTVACVVLAGIVAVIGYKLPGGAENPEIYAGLDLFGLVAYAVKSANARIAFHSLRSQDELVERLQNQGLSVSDGSGVREQIRKLIVQDRRVFDACRDLMVIQTVYGGREHFWDGNGNPKTAQWFLQAEIIVDIQSNSHALIDRLFQVTRKEKVSG